MTAAVRVHLVAAASASIGLGHDSRTALLAAACQRAGMEVTRSVVDPDVDGWEVALAAAMHASSAALDAVIVDGPDVFVADGLAAVPAGVLRVAFRMYGAGSVGSEDVAITPDPHSRTETRVGTRLVVTGRDYLFVRRSLLAAAGSVKDDPPRVVVTFGGADPLDLTTLAAEALLPLSDEHRIDVVVGRLNPRAAEIQRRYGNRLSVHAQGSVDFDALLVGASVAVINGGLTRYECVAARTPFVAVSLDESQARYTEAVVAGGFGTHAGLASEVEPGTLGAMVRELLADTDRRRGMAEAAGALVLRDADDRFAAELRGWLPSRPGRGAGHDGGAA